MVYDCLAVVGTSRAANFVEVFVQQLFQPFAAAANPGVMQLDLEGLEFGKQCAHRRSVLCSLTFELSRPA
jgi:hypothetical protein